MLITIDQETTKTTVAEVLRGWRVRREEAKEEVGRWLRRRCAARCFGGVLRTDPRRARCECAWLCSSRSSCSRVLVFWRVVSGLWAVSCGVFVSAPVKVVQKLEGGGKSESESKSRSEIQDKKLIQVRSRLKLD